MFYGKRAKKRLLVVKGLYLLTCFILVYAVTLFLMLLAVI